MELKGLSFIGAQRGQQGGAVFHAQNPATGTALEPAYHSAPESEAARAAELAAAAFPALSRTDRKARAAFLRNIATEIEALGQTLTDRVMAESGLAEGPG